MKILILSDVHLEISGMDPTKAKADVVILAGDIAEGNAGIYWARSIWPTTDIVYVAGKREFYDNERNATIEELGRAAEAFSQSDDNKMIEIMINQMNKTTASAIAAIDDALQFVEASNKRIEAMETKHSALYERPA